MFVAAAAGVDDGPTTPGKTFRIRKYFSQVACIKWFSVAHIDLVMRGPS